MSTYGRLHMSLRAAAFIAVGLSCILGAACGGGSGTSSPTPVAPAATSQPAGTSTARAGNATPAGAVVQDGYVAADALPLVKFDQMLGLQIIPGDEDHALLLTKDGVIRRVSLTNDAEAPTSFL